MRSATWARMARIWLGRAATSIQPCFRSQDDAVLGDAPLDDLVAAVANIADELGTGRAELALDRRFAADAADHLAAVASRCAPADAVGFEKHDGTAALGHRQCRRDAREAAADDAHVGLDRAFERRMARPVIGGRGVVRSYVILSLHERTISLHPSQAQILREVTSHSLHGRPPRRPSRAKSDIFVLHWMAGSSPAIE